MKKVILLFVAVLAFGTAQAQDFEKGGNYVTLGLGIDPYHTPYGGLGLGPIRVAYERGITDVLGIGRIGVGGSASFTHFSGKHGIFDDNGSRISLFVRGAYHFEFDVPKMDVYAGVGAGTHIDSYKYYDESGIHVGHHVFVGIRYYFTDAFGVYAEAGHGSSALSGGIVFAF